MYKRQGLGDDDADYEWNGIIEVNRLPETYSNADNANGPTGPQGAVQTYNLTVQVEKSSDTEITYARVNETFAVVDAEAGTIKACLLYTSNPPRTTTFAGTCLP